MKTNKIYLNGKLVFPKDAKISVFDGGYLYGEGLFETLLAVNGEVPFLSEHYTRLKKGAKTVGLPLNFSRAELAKAIQKTLRVNKLKTAYIRLNVSAIEADVGLKAAARRQPQLVIFTKPFEPYPARLYASGGRLIVIKDLINDPVHVAAIKSTNYLVKRMARQQVQRRKATEGILLNESGHVSECASSNIFLVKRGRVITPALEEGLIPGVTRKWVLNYLTRHDQKLSSKQVSLKAFLAADEVFITSTLKGIMPIRQIEGEQIGGPCPGPVTQSLMTAYQTRLGINFSKKAFD
jgi:branched-subunit amino acid aminotransferase/4-amino-4-deoxychorismate lyase